MKREWKPGDVALVTWTDSFDGEVQTQVRIRAEHGETDKPAGERADAWWGSDGYLGDDSNLDIRPIVVIDPEDREAVERLVVAHRRAYCCDSAPHQPEEVDIMQAALRSLVAPTKPEEPTGLGAVVEDEKGDRWVRKGSTAHGEDWARQIGDAWTGASWGRIDAVRILSEGVRP